MATEGVSLARAIPGDLEEIIMDWYLEDGESYEDAEIYARHAIEKMKFSAEEGDLDSILAQMYEIEDMDNPTEEDWIHYDNLETRYMELAGVFEAPYVGSGALMDIGKDTALSSFSPSELATSSAIHGDFDTASLDYSGHQNLEVRAEHGMDADSLSAETRVIIEHDGDFDIYKGFSIYDENDNEGVIVSMGAETFEAHHGHHSETSHSPSATIPSWVVPVSSIAGFVLGFFGIRELRKVL